jgi:hypothetical protein
MKFRKDKQKIELRPVDEKPDTKARIIRLGKDAVEEEVEDHTVEDVEEEEEEEEEGTVVDTIETEDNIIRNRLI